jgi:hypothetical protein
VLNPKQLNLTKDLIMNGGKIRLTSGSASSPGLQFTSDTASGIYLISSSKIGFATSGTQRVFINTVSLTSSVQIRAFDGSATTPSFSFSNATNNGIYNNSGVLTIATAGSDALQIAANQQVTFVGNLGTIVPVGTTTQRPSSPAQGTFRFNSSINALEFYDGTYWNILYATTRNVQSVRTITANYTVTSQDSVILVDASGGSVTITVPALLSGTTIVIKKKDLSSNAVVLQSSVIGATFDGQSSLSITIDYNSVSVITDGANWSII